MGGIDLSWIAGLAITSPVYYWLAKRALKREALDVVPAAATPP
jgi:4-amino-4-deoxy-L-arabinose transferase-like glycosyltransferase